MTVDSHASLMTAFARCQFLGAADRRRDHPVMAGDALVASHRGRRACHHERGLEIALQEFQDRFIDLLEEGGQTFAAVRW